MIEAKKFLNITSMLESSHSNVTYKEVLVNIVNTKVNVEKNDVGDIIKIDKHEVTRIDNNGYQCSRVSIIGSIFIDRYYEIVYL